MPPAILLIAVLALAAAALVASVGMFVYVQRQLWTQQNAANEAMRNCDAEIAEVSRTVTSLRAEYSNLEQRTGMLVAPPPVRSGLNLSVRTHAVRLLGRGEPEQRVAAALGLRRDEVHLLSALRKLPAGPRARSTAATQVDGSGAGGEGEQGATPVNGSPLQPR